MRPGRSAAGDHLESLIRGREHLVVPETVMLELLSGTTDEAVAARRRRMLESFDVVPLTPGVDSLTAARLQRQCRRSGDTVRNLGDCLIAAVALRLGIPVLHRDRDFETLSTHCGVPTISLLPR
nr:PIN domain-containing protein [Ornithinimicrobium sp. F0845]